MYTSGYGSHIHIVSSNLMNTPYFFFIFFLFKKNYILHQSVKLSNIIWLLQLVISSPIIHALGNLSQALTWIRTRIPAWKLNYPPPI